jgi:hypothetical protein
MQQLNAKDVKEKILSYLDTHGPSLPIPIAKHLGMTTLFASAFLSEIASDGDIKISNMKVGGSPLYYTISRQNLLENFTSYLGGKEREAISLLKEKKVLSDADQHPAIRVALRGLKDFTFPLKKEDKVYWRYFLITETEALEIINKENPISAQVQQPNSNQEAPLKPQEIEINKKVEQENPEEIKKIQTELEEKQSELDRIKKELEELKKQPKIEKQEAQITLSGNKTKKEIKIDKKKSENEEFLEEIKEHLNKANIEILNVEQYDKKQATIRIRKENKDLLLIAHNKKKVEEEDVLKAYKKSVLYSLPYTILAKGDVSKKTKEMIVAYKKLENLDILQNSSQEHNSNL